MVNQSGPKQCLSPKWAQFSPAPPRKYCPPNRDLHMLGESHQKKHSPTRRLPLRTHLWLNKPHLIRQQPHKPPWTKGRSESKWTDQRSPGTSVTDPEQSMWDLCPPSSTLSSDIAISSDITSQHRERRGNNLLDLRISFFKTPKYFDFDEFVFQQWRLHEFPKTLWGTFPKNPSFHILNFPNFFTNYHL